MHQAIGVPQTRMVAAMLSKPPLLGFLRRREAQADTAPITHGFLGLLRGQALGADEHSILADPAPQGGKDEDRDGGGQTKYNGRQNPPAVSITIPSSPPTRF